MAWAEVRRGIVGVRHAPLWKRELQRQGKLTMTQKLTGKFYPLQHQEWLKACKELTPSERDILYFIRTLDPYSDGLDVSTSEIAHQLSTESKTVHRSTVSRALKVLDQKGFIDLELIRVRIKIKPLGIHCCNEESTLPTDNNVVVTQQALPTDNKCCGDATSVVVVQQALPTDNNDIYKERARATDLIQTNTDLIQTGTEEEQPTPKIEIFSKAIEVEENQTSPASAQNSSGSDKRCSAFLSREEKLQELITKYENGEVSTLPADELRILANHFIGDLAKQYRKSGRILNPSPNDLNLSFKAFILQQDNKSDPAYASRLITKIEHDPSRWSELSDFVAGWNLEKLGQANTEIPPSNSRTDWDKCLSMASTNPSPDGLSEATKHALKAVGGFRGITGCKPENLKFAQKVFADAWTEYQSKNNQ